MLKTIHHSAKLARYSSLKQFLATIINQTAHNYSKVFVSANWAVFFLAKSATRVSSSIFFLEAKEILASLRPKPLMSVIELVHQLQFKYFVSKQKMAYVGVFFD